MRNTADGLDLHGRGLNWDAGSAKRGLESGARHNAPVTVNALYSPRTQSRPPGSSKRIIDHAGASLSAGIYPCRIKAHMINALALFATRRQ
jgi:hypothetical protein